MKFPIGITKKQKVKLRKIYEDTLSLNIKILGEKKAKNVAKARFYEEAFNIFMEKEKSEKHSFRPRKRKTYIKESVDYKSYNVDDVDLVVSTNEKILDKFNNAERKGLLRDMDDVFEQEVLFKAKDQYEVEFDPDMYYVIKQRK